VSAEPERTLEGWAADLRDDAHRAEVIDLAFDYRGDVTLLTVHGAMVNGYLYNRNRDVPEPFVQVFDPTGGSLTLRYAEIRAIAFTGKDTAAGKSWEAWRRRKAESASPPGA
jgi:hypothetical protein